MKPCNVVSFLGGLVNKFEPQYTLRLDDIIYSKSYGHEICVMQLVGKNAFPKYTTEELLTDPNALVGLSPQDAVVITRLDYTIKERRRKFQVLEIDRNGTILLKDSFGKITRYSEKHISASRELINEMRSDDAHDLGYRVGFREGFSAKKLTPKLSNNIKDQLLRLNPFKKKLDLG
ncbi:hypothetical protein [Legionella sp.]|uniref:hypothetical protein n=1 Tax=Legionella sp. TaxID=459 RepID=UPI003C979C33